jgi:hypothetical protein
MIKTEEFLLPAHWASYLINGDASGYEDEEETEIVQWMVCSAPGPCIDMAEDVEITRDGDDGGLMCERAVFTFQVIEELVSDGEVLSWT